MLELVTFVLPLVQAGALIIARPLGFIIVFPLFDWLGLQGMVRNVVALAIGLPFLPMVYAELSANGQPLAAEYVVLLAGKEFLVGVTLGVAFGAPFWAAEMAGAYVDVYRGSSVATVVSPSQMSEPLISGAIFSIALIAIFISLGGLRLVFGAVHDSYSYWPFFEMIPTVSGNLYPVFVGLLANIAKVALALGAPILIAMFAGELALAYASRFAPQINVFDAMLSIKNLIFLAILPPYLYLLTRFYGPEVLNIEALIELVREAAGGER